MSTKFFKSMRNYMKNKLTQNHTSIMYKYLKNLIRSSNIDFENIGSKVSLRKNVCGKRPRNAFFKAIKDKGIE